jgi:hypothetical protein
MWGPLAVRRMPFRSSAARAAPLPYLVERMMRGMKLTRIFEGTNRMSALGRYCCKSRKSNDPKNLAKVDF